MRASSRELIRAERSLEDPWSEAGDLRFMGNLENTHEILNFFDRSGVVEKYQKLKGNGYQIECVGSDADPEGEQRLRGFAGECSIGLIVFGEDYSYISIEQDSKGKLKLVQRLMKNARTSKDLETEITSTSVDQKTLYFRAKVEMVQNVEPFDAKVTFYYSTDGEKFKVFGESFQPSAGRWVGAKIGLFATGTKNSSDSSYADYDWFRVVEN